MTGNRQLEKARKWCQTLALARFSVVLDTATQKAVIVRYDGSIWRDVPAPYQAGATALLRNGETFTAVEIRSQLQSSQSYREESSRRQIEHMRTMRQPVDSSVVRQYLSSIS
jgi:hypothetical protein